MARTTSACRCSPAASAAPTCTWRCGELPPRRPGVVPGHEVVGQVVDASVPQVRGVRLGDRVGVAWLRSHVRAVPVVPSRARRTCARRSTYTGWDADGGYAELRRRCPRPSPTGCRRPSTTWRRRRCCAPGIIGYRALRRARLPPGGRLGIYGFGASAHLTAQIALAQGAEVHVLTRAPARSGSRSSSARPRPAAPTTAPPVPLDAAILFAPVGDLVPVALEALDAGGHARGRGHPPQRRTGAGLPAAPVPRAAP